MDLWLKMCCRKRKITKFVYAMLLKHIYCYFVLLFLCQVCVYVSLYKFDKKYFSLFYVDEIKLNWIRNQLNICFGQLFKGNENIRKYVLLICKKNVYVGHKYFAFAICFCWHSSPNGYMYIMTKTNFYFLCFFLFSLKSQTVVIFIDIAWLTLGVVWVVNFYMEAPIGEAKEIMLGNV